MKRFLAVVLMLLTLCSCSGEKQQKLHLGGITFNAAVNYYNENYEFEGHLKKDGSLEAKIVSPKELEDLNFTLNGESVQVEYKGLTYTPVEGSMPFSTVMEGLYEPLRELVFSDSAAADKEGRVVDADGKFTLTVSPTGLPQKLEIPNSSFEVRFYNVSVEEG